jgi:hypothetical protein
MLTRRPLYSVSPHFRRTMTSLLTLRDRCVSSCFLRHDMPATSCRWHGSAMAGLGGKRKFVQVLQHWPRVDGHKLEAVSMWNGMDRAQETYTHVGRDFGGGSRFLRQTDRSDEFLDGSGGAWTESLGAGEVAVGKLSEPRVCRQSTACSPQPTHCRYGGATSASIPEPSLG